MTARHEVFRAVFEVCSKIGDTYDYLPVSGTEYPFVFVGESNSTPVSSSDMMETIVQTIHIYAERTQRQKLEKMTAEVRASLHDVVGIYGYHIQNTGYSDRIIPDNTDVLPLLHVVAEATFILTKKEG